MTKEDLLKHTMDLSLRVIKLVRHLPALVRPEQLASLKEECTELLSIFVASTKTARDNLQITNLKSGNKSKIVNRK